MRCKVEVHDRFHFDDDSKVYHLGDYDTFDEAREAAKTIVNVSLLQCYEKRMRSTELHKRYKMFGDDPWIISLEEERCPSFDASDYAKDRARLICRSWLGRLLKAGIGYKRS